MPDLFSISCIVLVSLNNKCYNILFFPVHLYVDKFDYSISFCFAHYNRAFYLLVRKTPYSLWCRCSSPMKMSNFLVIVRMFREKTWTWNKCVCVCCVWFVSSTISCDFFFRRRLNEKLKASKTIPYVNKILKGEMIVPMFLRVSCDP